MGASVIAYWPGIADDQMDSQPGFYNDCKAWGDWMAEREDIPEVLDAVRRLGAEAILTYKTDGMEDADVSWVTPAQLREAVKKLREAVHTRQPGTEIILESYDRNSNGVDPTDEEFIRDLDDIEALAVWAEGERARRMTLDVNW